MKKTIQVVSAGVFIASVSLASGAFAQDSSYGKNSGFLGDYSALVETKDAAGNPVMRYVNPNFKPGAYQKVMVDPVQYYPAPQPTQEVTASTLTDISNYVTNGLTSSLGAKVPLATAPGPGVLRIRPAITAVVDKTPDLKPYQLIPVAFLFTAVKGRGKEAAIQIEVEVVDSVTGERMGAAVRKGTGAKMASNDAPLTLTDVMPLLNQWIDTGTAFIAGRMK